MSRLRKFLELAAEERRILLRAAFLLIWAEVSLRLLPLSTLLRDWAQQARPISHRALKPHPERITWLVEVAARHGVLRGRLRPTCLRKSLALCRLLQEQGWQPRLVLGARSAGDPSGPQRFQAHAWVELQGRTLGPVATTDYAELASFETLFSERQIA